MPPATSPELSEQDFVEIAAQVLTEVANDHPEDLELVEAWLNETAGDPTALTRLLRYKYPVVGPQEFVESPSFMNKPNVLWPEVLKALVEINDGSRTECVLTGGIGVAKSTIALYTQAYQLYVLSCLRNPHAEFDLDESSEIVIIFQSLNRHLAETVDYARFRDMIEKSPYFQRNFAFDTSIKSEMRFPNRIIVKAVSGADTAAIGQNVIGGVLDEINYMAVIENSKASRDGGTYDQAVSNYNSIARRRESRFMQLGALPGMLCLVSSKNYPGQFTDTKELEARTNPRIYVYDKRLWQIRPERFCGDTFRVFVGDETRKPRLLHDDEIVPSQDEHLTMSIPTEYQHQFEGDLLPALRDIAGVATQALHPFMLNIDAVSACFGTVQSLASRDDCDFKGTKLKLFPKRVQNRDEPRFVHIDLAISKDSAGVSIGHVPGFIDVNRGDHIETLPIVHLDLILEVRPPRGGEIEFENIRKLLYTLRDKLGVPIKWVTLDSFQSKDTMQILHSQGFITGYLSMDKDTRAYDTTKQAFYDGRVRAPLNPRALKELSTLEIDTKHNKIDHPPNGSKDMADSIAGVVLGLTLRRETWLRFGIPTHRIPAAVKEAKPASAPAEEPLRPGETEYDRRRRTRKEHNDEDRGYGSL